MSGHSDLDAPLRREFLRRLSALAATAPAAAWFSGLAAAAPPPRPLHVVVAGAGLAGLCAAFELEQRGHRVTVLEAEPRHIGGRTRTLHFGDGLYGEAGAMRIPQRHELTRRYAGLFGLELRRFVHSNPRAWFHLRGRRGRIEDWPALAEGFRLRPEERGKSPDDLWSLAVSGPLAALSAEEKADLLAVAPATDTVRRYDQQSLQQLCESAGLSGEAIEFLASASGSETLLPSAATEHLREELQQVWSQRFDEIVGGTDRLAAAFASRLKSPVKLGSEVLRLTQDSARGSAGAVYRERGVERRVEGDFLLCTLPFPVLSRLPVEPDFSGPKRRAIRELNYDSSTKVLFVCRRRFWELDDGIYGGGTYTDLPSGTTYYPSDNAEARDPRVSSRPAVMLASYTWGQAARRLATLTHAQRAATVADHLTRVHAPLAEPATLLRSASWSWDKHPYSGGAFAWFLPGQHGALHRDVVAPEGRIHFAGEHASLTHTWMQGALESALRAVRDLLVAAGAR